MIATVWMVFLSALAHAGEANLRFAKWFQFFAVSEQEVKEYQGIMRQQPNIKDASERERLRAQELKDVLAEEIITGLKSLESDSGKLPGAAPTLGAGTVAQGGVTARMAVANATVTGVRSYKSEVARMGAASGDQVARYLSEFFAKQVWIRPDQVRKARMIY